MMPSRDGFIGVFDSGVGGVSVLRALVDELPNEDFSYFGDSANAPYGEHSTDEILEMSRAIARRMVDRGAKAIVIACNTATSVAAESLRAEFPDVPVIGVEPAVKPAAEAAEGGRVLVMGSEVTLALEKYHRLEEEFAKRCEIVAVACIGLAKRIERGNLDAPDVIELLEKLVGEWAGKVDAVVLGCTHYPFVRAQIAKVLGEDVRFFDGGAGTARQLRRRLSKAGLLGTQTRRGSVEFASSIDTDEQLDLYQRFFDMV